MEECVVCVFFITLTIRLPSTSVVFPISFSILIQHNNSSEMKLVDGGKPLLKVRLRLQSSIHTSDARIGRFVNAADKVESLRRATSIAVGPAAVSGDARPANPKLPAAIDHLISTTRVCHSLLSQLTISAPNNNLSIWLRNWRLSIALRRCHLFQ